MNKKIIGLIIITIIAVVMVSGCTSSEEKLIGEEKAIEIVKKDLNGTDGEIKNITAGLTEYNGVKAYQVNITLKTGGFTLELSTHLDAVTGEKLKNN